MFDVDECQNGKCLNGIFVYVLLWFAKISVTCFLPTRSNMCCIFGRQAYDLWMIDIMQCLCEKISTMGIIVWLKMFESMIGLDFGPARSHLSFFIFSHHYYNKADVQMCFYCYWCIWKCKILIYFRVGKFKCLDGQCQCTLLVGKMESNIIKHITIIFLLLNDDI